ncbi:MAG: type II toxin-antitoxin system RelE/ParE family toxin [Candidatus Hodarchaeota archaeon]
MAQKESWEIVLTRPAEKVYDKSPKHMRKRLNRCFEELEKSPLYGNKISPLTRQLKGLYRYRIVDWWLIYRLCKQQMIVEIIAILPRGHIY